jgi:hypothetical protein
MPSGNSISNPMAFAVSCPISRDKFSSSGTELGGHLVGSLAVKHSGAANCCSTNADKAVAPSEALVACIMPLEAMDGGAGSFEFVWEEPTGPGSRYVFEEVGVINGGGRLGAPLLGCPAYFSRHNHRESCTILKNKRDFIERLGGC